MDSRGMTKKKLNLKAMPEEGGTTVIDEIKMSDEWQTVPAKKVYVPPSMRGVQQPVAAVPPSVGIATTAPKAQYVPPHMRKAVEDDKKKLPPDVNDKEAFPTLVKTVKLATVWQKTGTELANGLVALDKRTELELQEAEERERAKLGWESLKLHTDPSESLANMKRVAYNIYERERDADHVYDLMEMGMYSPEVIVTPPRLRATDPEAFVMDTVSEAEEEFEALEELAARIDDE